MDIEEMEILFLNANIAEIRKNVLDVIGNDGKLYRFSFSNLQIGKVKEELKKSMKGERERCKRQ